MKKIVILVSMAVLMMNLYCGEFIIDPNLRLPVYTGSINDPCLRIVYEDANGEYILVEFEGVLYVFYL
ncbi:MAG TPA: hypothetical protein PL188_07500 [Candidatus Cloacimonadota bacterium]|nr:hypothetical protein [Candidatus Cloacimonadota bacterium]